MTLKNYQGVEFRNTLEHRIRNWLVIQRYRLVWRYRLPQKIVLNALLGIERTFTFFKILN